MTDTEDYYQPDDNYAQKVKLNIIDPLEMVKEFSIIMGQSPKPELYAKLIHEEMNEWLQEYMSGSKVLELKELTDLAYVIFGYANANGWDLMESLRRVHVNNVNRCLQPDGTVKRRDDGKVMKNKNYPKVDLNDLV